MFIFFQFGKIWATISESDSLVLSKKNPKKPPKTKTKQNNTNKQNKAKLLEHPPKKIQQKEPQKTKTKPQKQ